MDISLFKYQMFLAEQMEEQAKYETCLNEAIMISSGENSISNIQTLQEAFADKIKEGLKKMFEMFKRMWAKFIEAMDTLIKKDKDYLEKYKDIILKKTPMPAEYTMFNYKEGIKKILNTSIPAFNYNMMKESLDSKEKFIEKEFPDFKVEDVNSFLNVAKAKFRGGVKEITINSKQLNMTDIYNFCIDYNKMKTSMEKDENTINRAANDANSLIDKMVREDKIKNTNESFIFDNKYYSYLYEAYILENDNPNNSTNNNNSNNDNGNNSQENGEKQINKNVTRKETNDGASKPADAYKGINGENKDMKEDDVKGENADIAKKRIEVYAKVCGDIMAAKLTITEEIYKAYMSIIKAHVRDYIGKKEKTDDKKAKDVGSNYNDNNENNKENKNDSNENKNEDNNNKEAIQTVLNKEKEELKELKVQLVDAKFGRKRTDIKKQIKEKEALIASMEKRLSGNNTEEGNN